MNFLRFFKLMVFFLSFFLSLLGGVLGDEREGRGIYEAGDGQESASTKGSLKTGKQTLAVTFKGLDTSKSYGMILF